MEICHFTVKSNLVKRHSNKANNSLVQQFAGHMAVQTFRLVKVTRGSPAFEKTNISHLSLSFFLAIKDDKFVTKNVVTPQKKICWKKVVFGDKRHYWAAVHWPGNTISKQQSHSSSARQSITYNLNQPISGAHSNELVQINVTKRDFEHRGATRQKACHINTARTVFKKRVMRFCFKRTEWMHTRLQLAVGNIYLARWIDMGIFRFPNGASGSRFLS